MKNKFQITYEVDDGYVGGSRPHRLKVSSSDVQGLSEKELEEFFYEEIENSFRESCHPYSKQLGEFMEWAKGVQEPEEE